MLSICLLYPSSSKVSGHHTSAKADFFISWFLTKKTLSKLEKNKIDSLIIDVRDNTGGHLTQVNKILSMFFDKKTLLYQIETKNGVENVYATGKDERNYEVIILIKIICKK